MQSKQLTRVQAILEVDGEELLGYNYEYNLGSTLYSLMSVNDKEKAKFLHDKGFVVDNKKFKLFNYSLMVENANYEKDGIRFNKGNCIKLILSGKEDILNNIILGMIKSQTFEFSGVKFKLKYVDKDIKRRFDKTMLYKVRTQVVESIYSEEEKKIIYLSPYQQEFYKALGQNLLRKYEIIYGEKYQGDLFFEVENILDVKKKYITNIKEKGFLIGYNNFNIYIQADVKMQKIAYYLGLGQNNSMGMGLITSIVARGV